MYLLELNENVSDLSKNVSELINSINPNVLNDKKHVGYAKQVQILEKALGLEEKLLELMVERQTVIMSFIPIEIIPEAPVVPKTLAQEGIEGESPVEKTE